MHHPDEPDLHLADEVRRLLVLARQEQAAAEAAFESLARRVTPRALSTAVVTVTNDLLDTRRWETQWL